MVIDCASRFRHNADPPGFGGGPDIILTQEENSEESKYHR